MLVLVSYKYLLLSFIKICPNIQKMQAEVHVVSSIKWPLKQLQ